MKRLILPYLTLILVLLTGCNHKDLCFDHTHNVETRVVFDWSNAPDANPESMELCMYPLSASNHLSYNIPGREGGVIEIPFDSYNAICVNNDDVDWALYRNTNDVNDFEVYTHDASELGAYQLLTSSLPRADGTEDERMAVTPGMAWSSRSDNISVLKDEDNVITLYPEEIVCHYSVEIQDVGNISSAQGETIDGTLSGMADGYHHGSRQSSDTPVTMPFILSVDKDDATLTGEFLTFGECNSLKTHHTLTVYLFLTDGSKWYYTFNVDDQVSKAPDPKHVHIVVSGLNLPKAMTSGGLLPEVNDWQTEIVDLKM
ncbi:MAG: DUF5119 domain-containing protein [Muribaculaceae bacterium]|nr:DUF5119 domain-containing protein [Muribaculaceae bacterium]